MANPKVYEYAKQIGLETLTLMDKIREWKLPIKSHMAELSPELIENIQTLLRGPATAEAAPKKVTKRKVTKKAEGTAPAPKRAAKAAAEKAGAPPKGTKKIIRRKAGEAQIEEEPVHEKEAVVETTGAEAEVAVVADSAPERAAVEPQAAIVTPEEATIEAPPAAEAKSDTEEDAAKPHPTMRRKREVLMTPKGPTSGVKSDAPRTNIIGRMDLSRVAPPGGAPQRGPRPISTTGPRNLRPGFIAQPQTPNFEEDLESRRRFEEKTRRRQPTGTATPAGPAGAAAGAGKEQPELEVFSASEFRKREMVFQPKKKKGMLNRDAMKTEITTPKASKRVVRVDQSIQVGDFAQAMGVKAPQIIKILMNNGIMATMNTAVDFDTAALVAPEFGYEALNVHRSASELVESQVFGQTDAEPVERAPVVTVMGHVDHGKTTLLDAIRNADVAAKEAGGITQHIGAYRVTLGDGKTITFIDTPGHEAFTAMRARGAKVTDIAIIVVAADDGVMPQTAEAINHAKAADVPIIVAVNKMDRPNANVDRIKQQMTEFELVPEEWGGSTIFCPVSALKKQGIQELLEQIYVVAEVLELKANPKRSGTGIVIEARLERGRGPVATLLVQEGSLEIGQYIVAGSVKGRVRSMVNDRGEQQKTAGPSEPVEVLGLDEAPQAGDRFDIVKDESTAEEVAHTRKQERTNQVETPNSKMSLDAIFSKMQQGDLKELPIVLKADVAGSAEAIKGMFEKLATEEVRIKLIHAAVGGISESDVLLASTAKGLVIGFNVRPDGGAAALAKRQGIEIKTYSIVYELMDDLKKAMQGLLKPEVVEKTLGRAEVRDIFTVPKVGTIAGCAVVDGKVIRASRLRLVRDGRVVYEGNVSSLKRFKDDVKEVASGYECGIGIENFNDVKVGDVIEAYVQESVAREL